MRSWFRECADTRPHTAFSERALRQANPRDDCKTPFRTIPRAQARATPTRHPRFPESSPPAQRPPNGLPRFQPADESTVPPCSRPLRRHPFQGTGVLSHIQTKIARGCEKQQTTLGPVPTAVQMKIARGVKTINLALEAIAKPSSCPVISPERSELRSRRYAGCALADGYWIGNRRLFASARARPVGCLAPLGCYATRFCNCLNI